MEPCGVVFHDATMMTGRARCKSEAALAELSRAISSWTAPAATLCIVFDALCLRKWRPFEL